MNTFYNHMLLRFWRDRAGQDLIEYALMAGFVAVAVGAVFPTTIVPSMGQIWEKVSQYLAQAAGT
jgi:pilus assembly protein Flp/PilA